jgi:hypothetical protein
VLCKSDRHILGDELPKVRIAELRDDSIHVDVRTLLIRFEPDALLALDREVVRPRELRITRVATRPIGQCVVGKADFRDQLRIDRVIARRDRRVPKRVVDAEKAQLQLAEIFVGRR